MASDQVSFRRLIDIGIALSAERDDEIYWPTHGTCIRDVKRFVQSYIDHRKDREQQILRCLGEKAGNIPDMVPIMYADTDKSLHAAAARSVLAAMERLVTLGTVVCSDEKPGINSSYSLGPVSSSS